MIVKYTPRIYRNKNNNRYHTKDYMSIYKAKDMPYLLFSGYETPYYIYIYIYMCTGKARQSKAKQSKGVGK
jgi:hypothetical protein